MKIRDVKSTEYGKPCYPGNGAPSGWAEHDGLKAAWACDFSAAKPLPVEWSATEGNT